MFVVVIATIIIGAAYVAAYAAIHSLLVDLYKENGDSDKEAHEKAQASMAHALASPPETQPPLI